MDDGSPIHIKVAGTGVSVKKSVVGSMGPKIYWQTNKDKVAMTCSDLSKRFAKDCTPTEMNSPVLKIFTNTALHCRSEFELTMVLAAAYVSF